MKTIVESFYNWYSSTLRHPKYRWLIILGSLLYLFSPIDISPDFIPIIGWLDDGIILTLLTTELSRLALDYRNRDKEVPKSEDTVEVDTKAVEVPTR